MSCAIRIMKYNVRYTFFFFLKKIKTEHEELSFSFS